RLGRLGKPGRRRGKHRSSLRRLGKPGRLGRLGKPGRLGRLRKLALGAKESTQELLAAVHSGTCCERFGLDHWPSEHCCFFLLFGKASLNLKKKSEFEEKR